jgi:RNA polymerase sigma-B factor
VSTQPLSLQHDAIHREQRPDPADVAEWCNRYFVGRDPALRRLIVERHHWLVQVCARQMRRRAEPLDDLVQTGQVALLLALERFDPVFGVSFRTFASATIIGELRRHYRSTWRVRVPRRVQELHLAVSSAIEQLTGELRRSPTVPDIARFLRVPETDVVEALAAGLSYWPVPLPTAADGDEAQLAGRFEVAFDHVDARSEIKELLDRLPHRERAILYLRFFHDMTQTEIAAEMHLSQVHVSRLMRHALMTLRASTPTGD